MSEKLRSEPRKFVFELTLGIDSSLSYSGGELATLILDGIFALDDRGLLFPGVTEPVDRLQLASCGATGFERTDRSGPIDRAYEQLIAPRRRVSDAQLEFQQRLDAALTETTASMLRQNSLLAKIRGLSDRGFFGGRIKEEDRRSAEALVGAAEAITATVNEALKPVL